MAAAQKLEAMRERAVQPSTVHSRYSSPGLPDGTLATTAPETALIWSPRTSRR
ncbi:hypothetical protein [Streptomyces sp. NPDC003006]